MGEQAMMEEFWAAFGMTLVIFLCLVVLFNGKGGE
jgi:hypothetical protein